MLKCPSGLFICSVQGILLSSWICWWLWYHSLFFTSVLWLSPEALLVRFELNWTWRSKVMHSVAAALSPSRNTAALPANICCNYSWRTGALLVMHMRHWPPFSSFFTPVHCDPDVSTVLQATVWRLFVKTLLYAAFTLRYWVLFKISNASESCGSSVAAPHALVPPPVPSRVVNRH